MPNAAAIIPAPAARPPGARVEYQATSQQDALFSGLLDAAPEPAPSRDRASTRAASPQSADRADGRQDKPSRRADETSGNARDREPSETPAPGGRHAGATSSGPVAQPGRSDAGSTAEGQGNDESPETVALADIAAETADENPAVVTPVAIALIVEPPAAADIADTLALPATANEIAQAGDAVDAPAAVLTPQAAEDGAQAALPGISEQTEGETKTPIAAAVLAAHGPILRRAPEQDAKSADAATGVDGEAAAVETGGTDEPPEDVRHGEFLKSLQAESDAKPNTPEQSADATLDRKPPQDAVPAAASAEQTPAAHAPAQAGPSQGGVPIAGVQPAAAQGAANPAAERAVPVAGLAIEIAMRAREGKNRFEIRLDPPELGRIDVRLDIDRQGNVTSRLLAERTDTLDLLRRDMSTLERALNDAGLRTGDGSLQFAMRDQGFSGGGQQRDDFAPNAQVVVPAEAEPLAGQARYGLTPRSGVDIRV